METSILQRIADGDRTAVEACLDRYGNLVWSLARRFTSNRADAEDAVQEVFIDLWSKAERFDPDIASEITFVSMIARRRLIDRFRKKRREPGMETLDVSLRDPQPAVQASLEVESEAAQALKMVEALKPEQQKILRLSVYEGYSHQKIADELDMPLGTVKTHLRRGLLRVREGMQRLPASPGVVQS